MGILRGVYESEREIVPKVIYSGDWPDNIQQLEDGTWYDTETGEILKSVTLEEFLKGEK